MRHLQKTLPLFLVISILAASVAAQLMEVRSDMKPSDFEKAAKRNAVLINTLKWKWGREQIGWGIYVPLINRALATRSEPETVEFATAVAVWQKSREIPANGVVDKRTLVSFIDYWQSMRIKPVYEAPSSALLDAPIREFYDETRSPTLLKVDRSAYHAYKKMLEAAKGEIETSDDHTEKAGKYLKIISSYRSPEYQAELRARDPDLTRAQLAFRSPHFTGRALDIYVGGDPVSTRDANRQVQVRTKAYLWLVQNAAKFGFYPYFYEPWHWEYVLKTEY